jgi:hypothetical protein
MSFSTAVRMKVLLWCDRHCCVCKKACGINIEVHHIVPEGEGGTDDIDNAFPLCFDCHSQVQHYNEAHPRGNKFKADELRARREQVYEEFTRPLVPPIHYEITQSLGNGSARVLPDVGFVVHNLGDALPIRLRVLLDIIKDGKSMGPPEAPHYSGQKLWNLNPRSGVSGHFLLRETSVSGTIAVQIDLRIIDIYDREHKNLPVSYVYSRESQSWYLEPSVEC